MTLSRHRLWFLAGAVVTAIAVAVYVLAWGQSGCGVSGCSPGGSTNAVQYNAGGYFGGSGPGTATTVLHGNASSPPSYSAVNLSTDVSSVLPQSGGGTGVSSALANQVLISNGTSWVSTLITDCAAASGNHLTYAQSTGLFGCSSELSGTTGSIGGSLLALGACLSGTVSVAGATNAMGIVATPVTYPGDGFFMSPPTASAGVVTVRVCAAVAGTPTASVYNVRVIP